MGLVCYRPLIEDMRWSYSRIESFNDCPYKFFLKYIEGCKGEDMFFASYGSFIHKLIERFYRGELTKNEMLTTYLLDFAKEVRGRRPKDSTVRKYINAGCKYLRNFKEFPFNMVDVEKRVEFKIGKYDFLGFIDYIGEKDGELYVVDNKSRDLKPRSGRAKSTIKDRELDKMLRQLYLYSAALEQEYGKLPKSLCFNCFKSGVFIEEKFDTVKYEETKMWAEQSIENILNEENFKPQWDYFYCSYICGMGEVCEYK